MKNAGLAVGFIAVVLLLGGLYIKSLNSTDAKPTDQTETSTSTDLYSDESMKNDTKANAKQLPAPKMEIDSKKTYTAVMKTSAGTITLELNAADTPNTVNNFVYLSKNKFYDNTIFHRVIKGFMIQGGDPVGNGTGGPGYRFDDEPFVGEYTRGTIAMANAGPDTNGSQFFIMHADYALPKDYVIFGKVVSGIEVVDKIAESEVTSGMSGENSTPVKPTKVESVTIEEK